ncbi:MAG: hypothetical protein WKF37_03175 [Bryobacteraceae bacterium]
MLVDGVPVAYNATTNSPDQAKPSYDAVAEFRVEAVIPPAEYGRTSGGVVSMVTRSGTNEVHGNVLTLLRNNIFDARRYNARIADITRQAETAGSIGGPVVLPKIYNGQNRTFFFVNYTNFRRANEPQGQVATVATEAMRRGDFSEIREPIYDPLTADANGIRQQFPNNQIPLNRLSLLRGGFKKLFRVRMDRELPQTSLAPRLPLKMRTTSSSSLTTKSPTRISSAAMFDIRTTVEPSPGSAASGIGWLHGLTQLEERGCE